MEDEEFLSCLEQGDLTAIFETRKIQEFDHYDQLR